MIPKEKIDELKKNHQEAWAAKRSAGLNEQLAAAAILAQIDHEKENPPEAEALRRVRAAGQIVLVHTGRQQEAQQDLKRVLEEVHAQFPDLDLSEIEIVLVTDGAGGDEAMSKLVTELREQIRMHEQAGDALDARAERDADKIAELMNELRAAKAHEEDMSRAFTAAESVHLDNLKDAQELLKQAAQCSSIKEVRELLKPADPQQTATTQSEG